jgi:hypothetical protein
VTQGLNLLGASQLQDSNRDQIYGPRPPSQPMVEIYFGTPRSGSSECSNLHFSPECSIPGVLDQAPHVHPNQWLRSTLGLRCSGVPDAHTTFSPKVLCTQSSRSSATRPFKSMTQVHFRTSAFGSFGHSCSLFSQSFLLELRIVRHASFSFDGGDPLQRPSKDFFLLASKVRDLLTVSHSTV